MDQSGVIVAVAARLSPNKVGHETSVAEGGGSPLGAARERALPSEPFPRAEFLAGGFAGRRNPTIALRPWLGV
jgi:hypothetical protein